MVQFTATTYNFKKQNEKETPIHIAMAFEFFSLENVIVSISHSFYFRNRRISGIISAG